MARAAFIACIPVSIAAAVPAFFRFAEELCRERDIRSIRVDTDADNRMMQRVLEKQGFTYCGTVCFDNSEKIAFEKLL